MKELTLEITGKCDISCPWCSSDAKPDGEHVSRGEVELLLEKYRGECDVVRFSGGEPTLHPDLVFLCSVAKHLGYYVVLLTNGSKLCTPAAVDRHVIGIVNGKSLKAVEELKALACNVRMEVVLVEGNEYLIYKAVQISLFLNTPLRFLVLQKQGRGRDCEALDLISWTGDKGCSRDKKISVLHDGRVITCSALKEGECVLRGKVGEC